MSIVSINYKMKDYPKSSLQQYSTVQEGVDFVNKVRKDNCEYISLTDGYGHQVIGFDKINKVYEENKDLFAGDKYCLHPDTDSNPSGGGGVCCPACRAWFCF